MAIRVRSIPGIAGVLLAALTLGCQSLAPGTSPACARAFRPAVIGGVALHTADDVLTTDSENVSATGRVASAYARVCAYIKDDDRWVLRGEGRSDARGWVSVPLGPLGNAGDYAVRLETPGDGAGAEATIFVRPEGTHFAVFDIDGTLTESEVLPALLYGHLAQPRPFGPKLAQLLHERGCLIVYLTARAHGMTEVTRTWRERWAFPRGVVHVTRSPLGLWGERAAEYKREFLESARGPGASGGMRFIADFAFGNQPSDRSAYLAVYPDARIYLMDYVATGEEKAQVGKYRVVRHSWKEVLDELGPGAGQPTGGCR